MDAGKLSLNQNKGGQEKTEFDIWASPFDWSQGMMLGTSMQPQKPSVQIAPQNGGETFPYKGHVKEDAWSSGFYSGPDKGTKTHDLPKWTMLDVLGRKGGWLQVKVLDGKATGLTGYISQERVAKGVGSGTIGQQGKKVLDSTNKSAKNLNDPNALFYTQVNGRLIVMPASAVKGVSSKEGINADQVAHAFTSRGSDVTVIYVTKAGDPTFDPIKWYSDASKGGTIDIWGAMVAQYGDSGNAIEPKPWAPGKKHPGLYIGTEGHDEIAAYYRAKHIGQSVFANYTPISSMLTHFEKKGHKVNRNAATAKELSDKPDITNVSLENLYEIKPWNDAAGAATDLTYYTQIFLKVGIPIKPGPSVDPGVIGTVPAPGGTATFMSPAPGIILYKRQQARRAEATLPATQPLLADLPEFNLTSPTVWDLKYWEDETGLAGTLLIMYLIVSEGSRLFLPRNLILIP